MTRAHHFVWSLLVLELLAMTNAYFVDLKGATVDAARFQELARAWSEAPNFEMAFDAEFYVQFLGAQFWLFGPSEFVATQLNIAALLFTAWLLVELVEEIFEYRVSWIVGSFVLWPSMLTRGTTTLREPIMVLIITAAALFATRYAKTGQLNKLTRAMVVLFAGALFHKAYAVLFAVFVSVGLWRLRPVRSSQRTTGRAQRVAMVVAGMVVVAVMVVGAGGERGLQPLVSAATGDTEYASRVIGYKAGRDFRTTYNAPLDASSIVGLVVSLPRNWIFYNLAPFPWQVSTPLDVLAFLEGMVRTAGIMSAVWLFRGFDKERRRLLAPSFMLHISIMAIFAAGTSNYGTASRHHLVTTGFTLLYIAGFLIERRRQFETQGRRHSGGLKKGGYDMALQQPVI